MSNVKKTIQINPELFKIQSSSKSRTKNNRDKTSKKSITPSFLKKQLIDRIKNHKIKLESSLKQEQEKNDSIQQNNNTNNNDDNDDEFILSMNFLSTLSNENKKDLSNKSPTKTTFIDHITTPNITTNVHIDLPIELLEEESTHNPTLESSNKQTELITVVEPFYENKNEEINITYSPSNDVPYGCLKNGNKPTYRSWINKSLKHNKNSTHVEHSTINREQKLNELKEKFSKEKEKDKEKDPIFIKRTIKKKYTLGKSNIKKKVGILIKNINTRKQITDSYKELKTHDITDIKKYLRNRGLLRIGNTTPHDILRKIYESSILTGDVTNNNTDIILHNLLNEE
jgi:hypothetical protein